MVVVVVVVVVVVSVTSQNILTIATSTLRPD
jgi:hypothetical protein